MIDFRKKYWQINYASWESVWLHLYVCLFFQLLWEWIQEMSHEQKNELKRSYHYKRRHFLLQNFSLFIKSSLDDLAHEASLHRAVTYAIYSETCIIVLGQLLIRLLILIKQSLPKRKHHLFYHRADGINGCSLWTQKKNRTKMLFYFDSENLNAVWEA